MNNKNLANAQLLNSIGTTDTTITVKQGQGADLPTAPFYATITPLGVLSTRDNSEIVQVTAVNIDELTVVRGQLDTTAKDFAADSVIANSIYVEDVLPGYGSDGQVLKMTSGVPAWGTDSDTTYSEISEDEIAAGTSSTSRSISGRRAQSIVSKAQTGTVKDTGAQTMTGPLTVDGDIYSNGEKLSAPTKYTDANGWTVYDNGLWKEYCLTQTGNPPSISSGSGWNAPTISLPVGVSSIDDVFVDMNATNTYTELRGVQSTQAMSVRFFNHHSSALDASTYRIDWHLRDK